MLTDVCQYLKNWFEKDKQFGTFTISNGAIVEDIGLQDGQYFRIVGSVFNDGVHKYESNSAIRETLADEVFKGSIWLMAVPPAVVALSERIDAWNTQYGEAVLSPYQSESFGGYSYTKAGAGSGDASKRLTWQNTFASDLNKWRKI